MKFLNPRMAGLVLALGASLIAPIGAQAQTNDFPNKPVRLLVGAPPGGSTDTVARVVAQSMGESLGQPVVIENRSGAGATLAAALVAQSPDDGYTLFMAPSAHAFAPSLYKRLPYDPQKDFEAVGQVGVLPLAIIVNADLPVKSLQDFVDLAKAKPNAMNFASSGIGSPQQLGAELLKARTGIQITNVTYKGTAPAMVDLLAGRVQIMFDPLVSSLPQIKAGRVKVLATTGKKRAAALPGVPTAAEAGVPGLEITAWYGILAPAGTPTPVIDKLNAALNKALANTAVTASLEAQGLEVTPGPPKMFADLVSSEIARWQPIIRNAGIAVE